MQGRLRIPARRYVFAAITIIAIAIYLSAHSVELLRTKVVVEQGRYFAAGVAETLNEVKTVTPEMEHEEQVTVLARSIYELGQAANGLPPPRTA